MALQEKHRSRFYAHLVDQVGEETAEAVLGQFPARDLDEPVTKEFVALTAAELREEIGAVRTSMAEMELRLVDRIHEQSDRLLKRLQLEGAIAVIVLAIVNALVG